jgi:galactokinase
VLIVNTNVRHRLAESEYAKRKYECELAASALGVRTLRDATLNQLKVARKRISPVIHQRAHHVITENLRVLQMATAIAEGAWSEAGKLMYASHASLRDDYQVSCAELDAVVEIAKNLGTREGIFGCRMTGGGFGGCTVALVKTDAVRNVTRKIEEYYERRTGNQATIFCTRPGAGSKTLT